MKIKCSCLILFFYSSLLFSNIKPPKLVVQIVVDQLRGDLINLYHNKMGTDGFNYLLANGLDYHNTHHPYANTVTCVGHASIATGSYPALHGIVSNNWYDKTTRSTPYCVADPQSTILPTPRSHKKLAGRSPKFLVASTLSDELVLAQKGRAFAVSFKDRAAITLAGHAAKAFWFDKLNGGFVTSQYYYSAYPQWVNDWNKTYQAKDLAWRLSRPLNSYHFAKAPQFMNRFPGFGQTFEHKLGSPTSNTYYKHLSMTPFADELTADFAISLLIQENLGKKEEQTDYLAISFSAVDAIGHQFGPNSLESEDNLLRLDYTLAQLFAAIDKQVGLDNTLIILTADHGASDSPAYLAAHKITVNQAVNFSVLRKTIEEAFAKHYKLPANSLEAIMPPFIYLNHQLIEENQLSVNEVNTYLADILNKQPAIYKTFSLSMANTGLDWLSAKIAKMAYPERSGDLYLVSMPYESFDNKNKQRVTHGTPWQYDSYVPLLFANPGFKAKRILTPTSITDIAPTIAAILLLKPPSAAVGHPLQEVLYQYEDRS